MKDNRENQIEGLLLSFHNAQQKVISQGKFLHPGADITFSQWVALGVVEKNKKCSIDEISRALHVSSSAATQLVNCLQKKGFVAKKVGINDRRVSAVELSLKAKKLFNSIKKTKIKHMQKLFSNFSDRELKTFVSLIKKLTVGI